MPKNRPKSGSSSLTQFPPSTVPQPKKLFIVSSGCGVIKGLNWLVSPDKDIDWIMNSL